MIGDPGAYQLGTANGCKPCNRESDFLKLNSDYSPSKNLASQIGPNAFASLRVAQRYVDASTGPAGALSVNRKSLRTDVFGPENRSPYGILMPSQNWPATDV